MKSLFHLAAELQHFLVDQDWRFCFIGGIALQRWGEPRLTRDLDISLLTGLGNEAFFIDQLAACYQPRIADARAFAITHRVLLLESAGGIAIDVSLAAFPLEEGIIRRSTTYEFSKSVILRTCSAEDLVVMKAIADRPRDWGDIDSVILRQGESLNWDQIITDLSPLCELNESPEILDKLNRLRER